MLGALEPGQRELRMKHIITTRGRIAFNRILRSMRGKDPRTVEAAYFPDTVRARPDTSTNVVPPAQGGLF